MDRGSPELQKRAYRWVLLIAVCLIGFMTVVGTFVSDLILVWIDPRIRVADGQ